MDEKLAGEPICLKHGHLYRSTTAGYNDPPYEAVSDELGGPTEAELWEFFLRGGETE